MHAFVFAKIHTCKIHQPCFFLLHTRFWRVLRISPTQGRILYHKGLKDALWSPDQYFVGSPFHKRIYDLAALPWQPSQYHPWYVYYSSSLYRSQIAVYRDMLSALCMQPLFEQRQRKIISASDQISSSNVWLWRELIWSERVIRLQKRMS